MSILAAKLDAAQPGRRKPEAIDAILASLPPVDQDALISALWDWDDQYNQYRVSGGALSAILTDAGHKVAQNTIAKYRREHARPGE